MNFRCYRNILVGLAVMLAGGCATKTLSPQQPDEVIVVPGIGGDGGVYGGVVQSLHDHGDNDCLRVADWGSSYPVFFISISSQSWHKNVEHDLAEQLLNWRAIHPHSRIALIAHSAGAGVVAGAIAQLPQGTVVGPVIFLAPALSPDFDLGPMLDRTTALHVFYSKDDLFWQGLGPTIFGNYDGAHRFGAGRDGFALASLTRGQKSRVIEHPYESDWEKFDNFGGHYDWMAEPFVAAVLKPIVDGPLIATVSGTAQSSAANPR